MLNNHAMFQNQYLVSSGIKRGSILGDSRVSDLHATDADKTAITKCHSRKGN